jgi:hypothetical protein
VCFGLAEDRLDEALERFAGRIERRRQDHEVGGEARCDAARFRESERLSAGEGCAVEELLGADAVRRPWIARRGVIGRDTPGGGGRRGG